MASIKYRLRNKSIIMDFVSGRKIRVAKSTSIVLNGPKNWSEKKSKVRIISDEPKADEYNETLRNLRNYMVKEFKTLTLSNKPVDNFSVNEIFESFFSIPANSGQKKRLDFNELFREYIDSAEKHRVNRKTGLRFEKNTIQSWHTTFSLMQYYQVKNGAINMDGINDELNDKILYFLRNLKQADMISFRNENRKPRSEYYNESYIIRTISNLKSFFNHLIKNKGIRLAEFYSDNWKVARVQSDTIYLNNNELLKLYSLDLSNETENEKIRDAFILSSWCGGMRISEYKKLIDENYITLDGIPCIKFYSKKLKKEHVIPIPEVALSIMKKYGNRIPKVQDQKSNEVLKKLGKRCVINEPITVHETRNGKRISKTLPKYKLIMNHTARRSFCTNAYKGGVDTLTIMAMSNHTSEKTFLGYIKVTKEEHAKRFSNTEYFKSLSLSNMKIA